MAFAEFYQIAINDALLKGEFTKIFNRRGELELFASLPKD